jgi:putative phosphonate transport system ATP-binding protein
MIDDPVLTVEDLSKAYGRRIACRDVSFNLWPGEVLAVVGESGSGKTTLLNCLGGLVPPDAGCVLFRRRSGETVDLVAASEALRRAILRAEWGFVRQNPRDGLRFGVSAGANVGEPLMAIGGRHYGHIRGSAQEWLNAVEIDPARMDDLPSSFSGGMQQRLQIARNLVTHPAIVLMDEPTGGLDVSVQARLLDLIRRLVREAGVAAIVVTHDLGVARLLADRMLVMKQGSVVEAGLTDQLLDDPQHAYTQLLVSSVLTV